MAYRIPKALHIVSVAGQAARQPRNCDSRSISFRISHIGQTASLLHFSVILNIILGQGFSLTRSNDLVGNSEWISGARI
jgi:hypothetical protein